MFCWGFVPDQSKEPKLRFSGKRISIRLLTFIVVITFLSSAGFAQQIRIMPLGDSITHGEHGSDPIGGFRDDLANMLLDAGINFNLVGTLDDGTNSSYPKHEGHPGKTAEYLAANVATWLNSIQPDIVLLHIGTNDINSLYANSDIRDDIERVCENIWSYDSNIPVLLCSVIPRNDSFNSANTNLCRLIQELAVKKLAEGKFIRYVGQNEVWITDPNWRSMLLYDAFHPENAGYHVMAETYFNIVMNQITGISQFVTDNFDRKNLGMTWNFETPYAITSNKLTIQNGGNYWWKPAVYVAEMDPISVAFDWGSDVNPSLDGNAGIALHLQNYTTTSSGYLVFKESTTKKLKLYLINNGSVGQLINEISGKQGTPIQGDKFRVSMYNDFQGYHFTCFINGNYDGDLIDSKNTFSSGANHFAGIMLAGTANNTVDYFELTHSKRAAENIHAVWGEEQAGQAATRLADSLVVMVTDRNGNPISAVPV
ncbi:MAG TPA: GDSL-type esterase/lipase family protein, partial [bacterium]